MYQAGLVKLQTNFVSCVRRLAVAARYQSVKVGAVMKLLVSLISPVECQAVMETPPDIIDIKNPADGSLGMPDISVIEEIRRKIPSNLQLSVAIGDADDNAPLYRLRAEEVARAGVNIVKVGLYDFPDSKRAVDFLSFIRRGLTASVVAARYVDLTNIREIREFPEIAYKAKIKGCLLDTYRKDGGRLADYASMDELKKFVEQCRSLGLLSALAGGLGVDDIGWLSALKPDIAGFRGAVAEGARSEPGISRLRLARLAQSFLPV